MENLEKISYYKKNENFKQFQKIVQEKQKIKKISKDKAKRVLRSGGRKMGFTVKQKKIKKKL